MNESKASRYFLPIDSFISPVNSNFSMRVFSQRRPPSSSASTEMTRHRISSRVESFDLLNYVDDVYRARSYSASVSRKVRKSYIDFFSCIPLIINAITFCKHNMYGRSFGKSSWEFISN